MFTNSKIYIIILVRKIILIAQGDYKMDKSKSKLNKLKIYHVPDDEQESYTQLKKNKYLQQYLDISGKSENTAKNSVYDPKSLDDFFIMHENIKLREFAKSRRINLRKNLPMIFQAVSLLLVFAVMISGNLILMFHQAEGGYAHDINNMRAETPGANKALEPVPFNREIYEYLNSRVYTAAETFSQNINVSSNISEEKIRTLVRKFNMLYIDQHAAGMPNGCEIVSLAMVLSRDYRDISVSDISENYLEKKPLTYSGGVRIGDDPTYYYIGNPENTGFGIFAPGLTSTANKILQSRSIARTAHDISGCSDDELFENVLRNPVIIWYTLELNPVRWGLATWHLPDNRAYSYPLNQHCAVLVDYTDATVILYDPIFGIIEYDRELFLRRWDETGPFRDKTRQAVVIR